MFYSQFILAKKGPLGTIWIAAHLERKLRKNQVADTDIGVSVDSILFPDVPIALRLSSHLLLGVVRIYSKKVGYLFDDCSDALLKVKQAFRSTAVDLPPEESTAPYHSITLPETFDLDDFELPDTHIFQGDYVDHHVSSREQITLQDTMDGVVFSTSQFGLDERFGDGDTSGLDLDEGLLGQLDNSGRNADNAGHAQAPSTPVMAEEPNLSNIQEVSAYDDHQEPEEDHHVAMTCEDHQDSEDYNTERLSTADFFTRETSNSDLFSGKENEVTAPLKNDVNSYVQKINPLNSPFDLPSHAWNNPFSEEAMSPASEYPGENLNSLDGVNGLQNGDTNNDNYEVTQQLGPETLERDQMPIEPHDSNGVEDVENLEKSFYLYDSLPSNVESPSRSFLENAEIRASEVQNDPKISSSIVHEKVDINFTHVLQPCKYQNQQIASIPESTVPVAPHLQSVVPDISSKEASERDEGDRPPFEGNNMEFFNLNDQYDNGITMEPQLDIPIANNISQLPAPEIMLSLPRGHEEDQVHLFESTPNRNNLVFGNVDSTGTNIIAGKKRTFTESTLTVDSLNSFESLGVVQSKRTKGSIPDDNDLLSSILVGKSSFLKLKPTPLPERTSRKRPRSTTRIVSSKKKVLVDDTMVLHGDQIRQQLTNTGDIRRMRKKAPCTRAEIWMIRKEYLVEEIFTEPIFTGFSSGLASIYSQAYDLSDIKLSQNENQSKIQEAICNDMSVHADLNLEQETEKEVNYESIPVRSDREAQSPERREDKTPSESLPHGHYEETSEIHINVKINSTADAMNPTFVNEIEPTFTVDPVSVDKVDVSTGFSNLSNGVQFIPLSPVHDQTLETQFVEMENSMVNTSSEKVVDGSTIGGRDSQANDELRLEGTEVDVMENPMFNTSSEKVVDGSTTGGMDSQANDEFRLEGTEVDVSVANGENVMNDKDSLDTFVKTYHDEGMDGFSKNELEVIKEVENLEFEVDGYDLGIEPAEASTQHVELLNSDAKGAYLGDSEHPGYGNPNFHNEMDPENAFVDNTATIDHGDSEYNMDEHDTGFLNEDDDEIAEEGEDCSPSAEHMGFTDNSGWSSRTRAVAKYLQVMFDKETDQGRKTLPMNNLLFGKTRKEASRMFFEALVLKTRDYIHIEQEAPFDNISMMPRGKLMKADF